MNEKGLRLLEDKFELGGEGSVSAGPVGEQRLRSPTQRWTPRSYLLPKQGFIRRDRPERRGHPQDQDMNQAVYKKSARQILGEPPVPVSEAPASFKSFPKRLLFTELGKPGSCWQKNLVLAALNCTALLLPHGPGCNFEHMSDRIEVFEQMLAADP